jgi:mono/diheme cytochrome c family protein
MLKRFCLTSTLLLALSLGSATGGYSLPFNDDMVDNQMRTGSIMRPSVPQSVPVGSLQYRLEKKEDALQLTNPKKGDPVSAANGRRLFSINCSPCHGDISATPWVPGQVVMGAPDLSLPDFSEGAGGAGGRSDGQIYGTMDFGNIIMPRVGWKLSPDEHWDIINYVRSVQARKNQK